MTQYLVTTFKDSTGRKHTHITKTKSNQRFTVVEAESKEEAKEKYETQNAPVVYYTNNSKVTLFERPSEEVLRSLFEEK
ncbi:phage protein [Staphylococcus aureus]|nr:phage protein [Staphylococcus aureus]CAC6709786.1 phage protein [Staphylococcus aureus]